MSPHHLSHLLYFKLYLYLFNSSSMFDHCLPIVRIPCVIHAFRHGLWFGFDFRHIHNQTLIQLLIVSKRIKEIDINILTDGELLGDVPITFRAFKARVITSINQILEMHNVVDGFKNYISSELTKLILSSWLLYNLGGRRLVIGFATISWCQYA